MVNTNFVHGTHGINGISRKAAIFFRAPEGQSAFSVFSVSQYIHHILDQYIFPLKTVEPFFHRIGWLSIIFFILPE